MSADALQVYRGLETLTGAATPAEQQRLEHRLLSILPVDAPFSAGRYAELAHREIDELLAAGRRPIVVGGTGLYLRAALAELDLRPPVPAEIRQRWLQARATRPAGAPRGAEPSARRRRRRWRAPTRSGSSARSSCSTPGTQPPAGEQLWTGDTRHPTLLAGLTMDRAALDARIDARVDEMVAAGAARRSSARRRPRPRPCARRSASASCSRATSRR